MSLGFNGLVADWYWLRSLQYVGRKMRRLQGALHARRPEPARRQAASARCSSTRRRSTRSSWPPTSSARSSCPPIDGEAAVRLVEQGIRENPQDVVALPAPRLHPLAGRPLPRGERGLRGRRAPARRARWMNVMAAQMSAQGGSRARRARDVSAHVRGRRRRTGQGARRRASRCSSTRSKSASAIAPRARRLQRRAPGAAPPRGARSRRSYARRGLRLDASGAPLDPSDVPYVLDVNGCEVKLDERSLVPKK